MLQLSAAKTTGRPAGAPKLSIRDGKTLSPRADQQSTSHCMQNLIPQCALPAFLHRGMSMSRLAVCGRGGAITGAFIAGVRFVWLIPGSVML